MCFHLFINWDYFDILNLSGKIYVVNIWIIISVNNFIRASLTNLKNREEKPLKPQLILG